MTRQDRFEPLDIRAYRADAPAADREPVRDGGLAQDPEIRAAVSKAVARALKAHEAKEAQAPAGTAPAADNRIAETLQLPSDFGFEDEHPLLDIPFVLTIGEYSFSGHGLSLTHLHVSSTKGAVLQRGARMLATLSIPYENFTVTLRPVVMAISAEDGMAVFQFAEPTGDHLPQLRYILNSTISGDAVAIDGLLSYSGPTEPKKPKAATQASVADRVRSIAVAGLSALLVLVAAATVYARYTTGYELHPVFIERAGQPMRATAAGQLTYMNPAAAKGEAVYAIQSNSGDVLSFQMPCDCELSVAKGISEGMAVLPTDLIMTILTNSLDVRVQTMMSLEGLTRAMRGDRVSMEMTDGRSIPVTVSTSPATTAASLRGEVFVPVNLTPTEDTLSPEDVGNTARLRLSRPLLDLF